MKKTVLLFFVFLTASIVTFAQITFPENGVKDQRTQFVVFKNAILHVDAKTTIQNGWLLIKDDKIEKIGKDFDFPKSALVYDLMGKHIYPSFVDIYSDYGMPELKRSAGFSFYETQFNSKKDGAYAWNQAIKPEIKAAELFKINPLAATELRKIGFGAVVSHQKDGIIRGTSALISLNDSKENNALIKPEVSSHFSFDKGTSTQSYPISLMGSVALLRQSFYDTEWYKNGGFNTERNLSLAILASNMSIPLVFNGKTVHDIIRAQKIGVEFNHKYILKSGGDDYQKINEIKALNSHLIVPVAFPKAIDVEDPLDAENVTLTELKHWEMAPSNLAKLAQNNISFSITSADLSDKSQFLSNLKKATEFGISKTQVLEALTTNPAKALKIDDLVGSLKNGLLANFLITNEEILEPKCKILENWVQGNKYTINDVSLANINGKYKVEKLDNKTNLVFDISGENEKPSLEIIENDTIKTKTTLVREANYLTFNYVDKTKASVRLSAIINNDQLIGEGRDTNGKTFVWSAKLDKKPEIKTTVDSTKKSDKVIIGEVIFPFTAFGNAKKPISEELLIKNATLWTNEKEGNVKTDILVKNGKIASIGSNIVGSAGAKIIDGTNKHLTSGIIDEHSHIALFSINELETVSAEVRQEDVIDSEDIDIYRQLAGGVTTSQLLHGSADCIGGQSAIIKLKWGESPDKLIINNSPKFIKFALGENVKRGNAPQAPNRFPSTRMGVEQVFVDAFTRAKAYKAEWANYNLQKIKTGLIAPRKDLELETIVEILDGKRNITCHSYVQSEINMLMRLSDSLGFKVNTLTHILEGYKVADKMAVRGINASTFSDWWAYKMEVKEAIPYNATIMTKVGVNTAINSDDAEMARRLNQEAAKTILYGGLTELEAWKTVTLNPAKMLHLDDRLGSIKIGKDADLVLWDNNPLSIYAKPEKTIIDGIIYFDLEKEEEKAKIVNDEKNRIIQKLLFEKSKGAATAKPMDKKKPSHIHCDSILEFGGISVEEYEAKFLNSNN